MATTKRPQNKCKKCGYTWYPRGKRISLKCPNCGSNEVGFAGGGLGLVAAVVLGLLLFGGKKAPNEVASPPTASAPAEMHAHDDVAVAPGNVPDILGTATQDTAMASPQPLEQVSAPASTPNEDNCAAEEEGGKPCRRDPCDTVKLGQGCMESNKPANELY
ncbi:hypothetical protein ABT364_05775 [Massilia sp. SR12]